MRKGKLIWQLYDMPSYRKRNKLARQGNLLTKALFQMILLCMLLVKFQALSPITLIVMTHILCLSIFRFRYLLKDLIIKFLLWRHHTTSVIKLWMTAFRTAEKTRHSLTRSKSYWRHLPKDSNHQCDTLFIKITEVLHCRRSSTPTVMLNLGIS